METMTSQCKYYFLHCHPKKSTGVAYAPKELGLFILPATGYVNSWNTVEFQLKDGTFVDYQPNDMGVRLFSEKLKNIISSSASKNDKMQWFDTIIKDIQGESRVYYILHFPEQLNVLDNNRTIFATSDFVVKAILSLNLIEEHDVFTFSGARLIRFIVSEKVKKNILKEKCTGVSFSIAPAY